MRTNPTEHNVLEAISKRWSPYRYDARSIEPELLARCFEAARWAASSFNEQPWRWLVALRDDEAGFEKMLGCLMEPNRGWAANAGALVLTAYRPSFTRNENPNRVALHDLGQAAALFSIQAAALGLQVHQMAGIHLSQIRAEYQIPAEFEPATAIAIGYPQTEEPGDEQQQALAAREIGARKRKPLNEQVFTATWGSAVNWS